MSTEENHDKAGFIVAQERDGIDRRTLWVGAMIGVFGIATSIVVTFLFLRSTPSPMAVPPAPPQADTSFILATERGITLRKEQRASLERWGWVDRDAGVARIPVERAMDLIAAEAADGGTPP